ncbi:RNA-binding protein [Desulfurococcus amylolyticus]|uniref:Putative RNA-binding protein, contains THUMP domain n=1 Tax=Desulfurococcus amylolyticus DSM 16532 TaxID=768672 RepID=I3XPT9_DESAM|nr:RNA-binding protein [Desulfurococcus amylolyticus]AFL65963.1 putative RNA-binding protein, contains THUMP domain [Desulfurococcus amylolyticus DSM 16532]
MSCRVVLLVTCRTGSDEWCAREIGDVVFGLDNSVVVEKTGFPGLLQVYGCRDVDSIYKRAISREYGFVETIIPVHCIMGLQEVLEERLECIDGLKIPGEVRIRVRMRGVRELSTRVFALVLKNLRSRGVVHTSSADECLFIEGIKDRVYIGLGRCRTHIAIRGG